MDPARARVAADRDRVALAAGGQVAGLALVDEEGWGVGEGGRREGLQVLAEGEGEGETGEAGAGDEKGFV